MKKVVMSVLLTVFALTGVAAARGPATEGPGGGPGYRGPESRQDQSRDRQRVARALSLTEREREKLSELQKEYRGTVQAMRTELREQRQALREIMQSEGIPASEAKKSFLKTEEIRSRIHERRFEMQLQKRELLGPERFAKLREMEVRAMDKGRGRFTKR